MHDRNQDKDSKQISPNKTHIDKIKQTKANLDQTIEQLNIKLQDHFQKKQQQLIEQYKIQLINAQKQLSELKATTNQQQIKNKMLERKKQLQRERHQLIQANIFFSSKCQDYKKKLADLVAQGKDLQRQLTFLDSQLEGVHKKKYQALGSSTPIQHSQRTIQIQKKISPTLPVYSNQKSTDTKMINSISVRETNKKQIVESALKSKIKRNLFNSQSVKSAIEKTPLQQQFEQTVQIIKEKRKTKKGMPILKGQQFTDLQKRAIMQQFLSREEVKKKIYQIIFEQSDNRNVLPGSFQPQGRVKISFDDIN